MPDRPTGDELREVLEYCGKASPAPWKYYSFGSGSRVVSLNAHQVIGEFGDQLPCSGVSRTLIQNRMILCPDRPASDRHWIHAKHDDQEVRDLVCAARSRTDLPRFAIALQEAYAEIGRVKTAYYETNKEVEQALGKAMDYPWFKDDPNIFPGATESDGVCIGDHVTGSIADEAAELIDTLKVRVAKLEKAAQYPMQPIVLVDGVARFRENNIIRCMLDVGPFDMNQLAVMDFTDVDREQFAQLIGYSVSGAGDLDYMSDELIAMADKAVDALLPKEGEEDG